jgi:hypothetical protein
VIFVKTINILYSIVAGTSATVIGTTYTAVSKSNILGTMTVMETISHPTFLLTTGVTLVITLLISGLIHIFGKRNMLKSAATTGETSTISGFRVGTKTGTGN